MSSILVINASDPETRVALVENGHISEFYLERNQERGIVGNIYKGKVVRVLPGMQAAFVDIGLDKAAFLYVSDVTYDPSFSERQYDLTEGEHPESESPPDVEADGEAAKEARAPKAPNGAEGEVNIQDLLKEGQEILVQVVKDPIGTKGARISCHISIPGRHLVFMPTVDHIGISRRIENDKERRRLREIVEGIRPPGTGFIVRTVAEGVPAEKLQADARFLMHIWDEIQRKKEKPTGPTLLHPDLDIVLRATRDLFSADVEKLVIDDREQYERIMRFVKATDPALAEHVEYYTGEEPIFDAYGIEHELQRAQQRKVWLKSGGYIVIDQAEALTAIDVNSGRYVGKKSLEETITKINIEAAKEIVYQLRLRNIGGIIIIDFIDMDKGQNRDKVFKALQEALGKDKAKTNVLKISELGLVEMTRKRVRESIGRMMNEPCPYCDGRGTVKSRVTVAYEIFREIRREATAFREPILVINCHPEVAKVLQGEERENLRHLMDKFNKTIQVRAQQHYHIEQFDFVGRQDRPKPQRPSPQKAAQEARAAQEAKVASQEATARTEEGANAPAVRNGELPEEAPASRAAEAESVGEKTGEPGAT